MPTYLRMILIRFTAFQLLALKLSIYITIYVQSWIMLIEWNKDQFLNSCGGGGVGVLIPSESHRVKTNLTIVPSRPFATFGTISFIWAFFIMNTLCGQHTFVPFETLPAKWSVLILAQTKKVCIYFAL